MTGILLSLLGGNVSAVPDPYFEYTTLLLPGNGTNGAQNNTFLDGSTNNFTITRNGNTTQGTFSPFSQTGWANYTTSGNAFRFPDSADFSMGTNAFTVEAFVYVTKTQSVGASIVSQWISGNDNNSSWMIGCDWGGGSGGTKFEGTISIGGTVTLVTDTVGFALNTWHHVVLARSGSPGTLALFVNGVRKATATPTGSIVDATNPVGIGIRGGNDNYYGDGIYISNVRIVNGTDVYGVANSTIPVPTAPLTAITNTKLLTCQSNRFVDTNTQVTAKTPTFVGSPSVQAFSPFNPTLSWSAVTNGGSGYFDGNGDYLSYGSNAAFSFGTGDFTVEAWIYITASALFNIFNLGGASTGSYSLYWDSANQKFDSVRYGDAGPGRTTNTYQINQWLHVAAVRSSGTAKLYINGVEDTGATYAMGNISASSAESGRVWQGSATNNGYISSLRIVKGTAVYTSNFTPPTAPVTNITNTSLLLNYTNAGIYDATSKNDLETVGNAQISTTQSKWGGSSMYFDGTGDWLLIPDQPIQRIGTGNFTIEGWVYRNSSGTYGLIGKGTGTTGWLVSLNSSNQVVFTYGSSTITSTGTVSATTWTHIAVVREGTSTNQTKIYINGSNDGTGTVSTDFNQTSSMYVGADRTGGSAANAYMQDVRVTNYARYTSNFTAPTAPFPLL